MKKSCSACGLLTRKVDADAVAQQVPIRDRKLWRINILNDGSSVADNLSRPQCLISEEYLQASLATIKRDGMQEDVQAVLDRENGCANFRPYLPGFGPKEHYEMMWHEWQRDRDLAWQEECREKDAAETERRIREDREWQDAMRAKQAKEAEEAQARADARLEAIEQRSRQADRSNMWWNLLLGSLLTIIASFLLKAFDSVLLPNPTTSQTEKVKPASNR